MVNAEHYKIATGVLLITMPMAGIIVTVVAEMLFNCGSFGTFSLGCIASGIAALFCHYMSIK